MRGCAGSQNPSAQIHKVLANKPYRLCSLLAMQTNCVLINYDANVGVCGIAVFGVFNRKCVPQTACGALRHGSTFVLHTSSASSSSCTKMNITTTKHGREPNKSTARIIRVGAYPQRCTTYRSYNTRSYVIHHRIILSKTYNFTNNNVCVTYTEQQAAHQQNVKPARVRNIYLLE